MEIESLRLDFLTLIILINITKAQNISEKEEKKKTRRTQAIACDPGGAQPRRRATWAVCDA